MSTPSLMIRLRAAVLRTRGRLRVHYATAVRAGGWALGGYEALVDRFHNLGLLTAAAGMIMFKAIAKNGNGGDR